MRSWYTQYPFAFIEGSNRYEVPLSMCFAPILSTTDPEMVSYISLGPSPEEHETWMTKYAIGVKAINNSRPAYYYTYVKTSISNNTLYVTQTVVMASEETFAAEIYNGNEYNTIPMNWRVSRRPTVHSYTYDNKKVYYCYASLATHSIPLLYSPVWIPEAGAQELTPADYLIADNGIKYYSWLIPYGEAQFVNDPYNRPPTTDEDFPRGGNGTWDNHSDPIEMDPLPTGAWGQGFVSVYNPTNAQLQNFATQIWREDLRNTWQDIFPNGGVMSGIVNCITIPVQPDVTTATTIHVGGISIANTEAAVLLNRFKLIDFGSIPVRYTQEYFGGFQDYSCTKIGIYLPYIGWEQLAPEMVINCTLNLQYKIDCFTGDFVAILNTYREDKFHYEGISYIFNGNCATQVPITSQSGGSSASMISAAIAGITSIGSLMTGNVAGAVSGGALAMNSIGAENDKHSFALKGGLTGSKGQLSYQRPYLCINRPIMEDGSRNNYFNLCGIPSNDYATIGECLGFTKAYAVKLDSSAFNNASEEELQGIVDILKEGIFCNLS